MSEVEAANATQIAGETQIQDQASVVKEETAVVDDKANLDEAKADSTETTEQKKVVPEKYELNPEGLLLSKDKIEKFESEAKDKGLTQEEFEALVSGENSKLSDFVAERKALLAKQTEVWKNEVLNDSEYGGDRFLESSENAKRAVEFGGDELKQVLNESGLGNHPALFKAFAKIGKAMSEDTFVKSKAHSSPEVDRLSRMYPSMK